MQEKEITVASDSHGDDERLPIGSDEPHVCDQGLVQDRIDRRPIVTSTVGNAADAGSVTLDHWSSSAFSADVAA
jgi:hypothetical protein